MKRFLLAGGALLVPALTLVGCGGGNGGIVNPTAVPTPTSAPTATPGPILTGNTAIRAAFATGYQGYRSQVNYPIRALMMSLPSTSPFKKSATAKFSSRAAAPSLVYFSELGLYVNITEKDNVTTFNTYSDAAGTQSAGTATITTPPGTTSGEYASYPAVVQLKINITGGNIPCQGSGTLTFTGPTGSNTLTGQLFLSKTGVTSTANLSLSSSGQIGGAITFKENGQTTTLSNLSGSLDADINGIASVSPGGATGTGVVNLFAGKYEITLKNSAGTATASANPTAGSLNVTFPDGTKETLQKPLDVVGGANPNPTTAPTTGPTTKPTTGPTTAPTASPTATPKATSTPQPTGTPNTTSFYNAPVAVNDTTLAQSFLNNQNQLAVSHRFFPSPQASPQTIKAPPSYDSDGLFLLGLNNRGSFVGNVNISGDATEHGAFWTSPSSPVLLKPLNQQDPVTVSALNDSNAIVGASGFNTQGDIATYWSGPTVTPITLPILSDDPKYKNNSLALAISSKGQIVGWATGPGPTGSLTPIVPVYWPSSSTTPQQLASVSGQDQPLFAGINAKGNIFLSDNAGTSAFYASPGVTPQTLIPAGKSGTSGVIGARALNASGIVVGADIISNAYHAVRWTTGNGQPKKEDLNSLIPAKTGWVLAQAYSINDQGDIAGYGTLNGKYATFYLAPNPLYKPS